MARIAKPCLKHEVVKCRRCLQDKQNIRSARARRKNPGVQIAYNKKWLSKNKKRIAEYMRAYYLLKKGEELMRLYKEKYCNNEAKQ